MASLVLASGVGACNGETTIGVGRGHAGYGGFPEAQPYEGGNGPVSFGGGINVGPPSLSGSSSVGGEGGAPGDVGAGGESTGPIDFPGEPLTDVSKLDLLFVVDNSYYKEPLQEVFRRSVAKLLGRLTEEGRFDDIHVGVISTSLGAVGGTVCTDAEQDDRAHLIPTVRGGVPSWDGRGFSKWDPRGEADPPGHSDPAAFVEEVDDVLAAVGSNGCGYEASLEAWYRFLVDPDPYFSVARYGQATGIDETVLAQRAAFLRPDSALAVVLMTDENDCSIKAEEQGWLTSTAEYSGTPFRMPPPTSQCATDPNDPCCRSCATPDADYQSCPSVSSDPVCAERELPTERDPLNLRCWDQKRRFGVELLYPVDRYVRGLSSPVVPRRYSKELSPNPIFPAYEGKSRRPEHVVFAALVGVPWQDLADEASLTGAGLRLLSAQELVAEQRWSLMLPEGSVDTPDDPFMRESATPRSGTNPLTGDAIAPTSESDLNAINGHEDADPEALENACAFPITPVPYAPEYSACTPLDANKFECRAPDGTYGHAQYNAGATPGTRQLEVLSRLGGSAVVGSICPKILDEDDPDGEYMPVMNALFDRLKVVVR